MWYDWKWIMNTVKYLTTRYNNNKNKDKKLNEIEMNLQFMA